MPWLWTWLAIGLLLTATTALALRLLPGLSASTRSVVWATLLLAIPMLGVLLAADAPRLFAGDVVLVPPVTPAAASSPPTVSGERFAVRGPRSAVSGSLLFLWAGATTIGLVRLASGLITLRRWRARCRPLPAAAFDHLSAWPVLRREGRQARLAWSSDVTSPCVLGLWAPIIALPREAATLEADTLDAILVHELAHVRRYDDIAQFIQHLVRACAAAHPAVWWIDRQLTVEREAACDDWVVTLASSPRAYARCLVGLAACRTGAEGLQVAMRGGRSQLAARVHRLVDARRTRRLGAGRLVLTAVPSSAGVAVLAALSLLAPPTLVTMPSTPEVRYRHADVVRPRVTFAMMSTLSLVARPEEDVTPRARAAGLLDGEAQQLHPTEQLVLPRIQVSLPSSLQTSLAPQPVIASRARSFAAGLVPATTRPTVASATVTAAAIPATIPADLVLADVAGDAGGAVGQAGVAIGAAGRDAGMGIARGGVATAGFFTRLGRRVARTF